MTEYHDVSVARLIVAGRKRTPERGVQPEHVEVRGRDERPHKVDGLVAAAERHRPPPRGSGQFEDRILLGPIAIIQLGDWPWTAQVGPRLCKGDYPIGVGIRERA